ncbi:MAG: hypothetical protein M0R51_15685 [Clostridia bacterium]|jgi:hypothetical protein|nr:hypothetical protein [Clostridia bacterium]
MSEKVYLGSGTEKTIKGQNGEFNVINLYFSAADLAVMMDKANQTAKGAIIVNLYKKQKPSKYGQTHYGVLSVFEPKGEQTKSNSTTASKSPAVNDVINKYRNAGAKGSSDTMTVTKQEDIEEEMF